MAWTPTKQLEASAREAAERVALHSYAKLVALLAARIHDVDEAEDALSAAFLAALSTWPEGGVPRNPEAWLLTVARRKWIDTTRRRRSHEESASHLRLLAEESDAAEAGAGELPCESAALMFICAHDALDPDVRAPLVLQTVLGYDAAEIAAALHVSPGAMRQRLVRAKQKIREAGIPLRVSPGAEMAARLDAVLEAIRAIAEAA